MSWLWHRAGAAESDGVGQRLCAAHRRHRCRSAGRDNEGGVARSSEWRGGSLTHACMHAQTHTCMQARTNTSTQARANARTHTNPQMQARTNTATQACTTAQTRARRRQRSRTPAYFVHLRMYYCSNLRRRLVGLRQMLAGPCLWVEGTKMHRHRRCCQSPTRGHACRHARAQAGVSLIHAWKSLCTRGRTHARTESMQISSLVRSSIGSLNIGLAEHAGRLRTRRIWRGLKDGRVT